MSNSIISSEESQYLLSPTSLSVRSQPIATPKRHASYGQLPKLHDQLPLTRDRLEKKDQLDTLLLSYKPVQRISRRRSIDNGNIYKRLYNDDNTPMVLSLNFERKSSNSSDASINSPNSDYNQPIHYQKGEKRSAKSNTSDSAFSKSTNYDSFTTVTRPPLTKIPSSIYSQQLNDTGPRRFSSLVRLSATHIAMKRRGKKKRTNQSHIILAKLIAVASRVIDARTSEPPDTRMSVNELTSLSRYLHALKYGGKDDTSSDTSSISVLRSSKDVVVDHREESPILFSNPSSPKSYATFGTQQQQQQQDRLSPIKKRNLGSLGNIFPFAPPFTRLSTLSRTNSEQNIHPTETDFLLPKPKKHHYWIQSLKHQWTEFVSNQQQSHTDNTRIQFEGWSLFIFSPTSLTRFYLWKLIGSSWFEIFVLALLFTQWIVLSFIPIRFNTELPFFSRSGDYIIFFINIIYTLEAISKIIVYGFVKRNHSTTRPTILSWINRMRRRSIQITQLTDEEDSDRYSISCMSQPDSGSIYTTRSHHTNSGAEPPTPSKLPAYASRNNFRPNNDAASILSMASSLPQHSSPSHTSSEIHWANTSVPSTTSIPIEINNIHPVSVGAPDDDDEEVDMLVTAQQQVFTALDHEEEEEDEIDYLKVKHTSYLSSVANVIDFISIISYWMDVIMILGYNQKPWSVFQAMAATRLLRFLVMTEGTAVIIKSLRSSYDMLKNVLGFFVFFWLLFSLVGLFIFMNAFSRRCAVISQDAPLVKDMSGINYVEPRISCSGYMTSSTERSGVFDLYTGQHYSQHGGGDGLYCKLGQICIQDTANQPGFGHISFENIFYTMLNILTVISTEDWTDLLYISQDSISELGSAVFFSSCIYLMTFIVVPMFIAVITTSFSHVRDDMRTSAFSLKRKARLLLAASSSGPHRKPAANAPVNDDDSGEDWIYEGTGLAGANLFQKRFFIQAWIHYIVHARWFPYLGSVLVLLNVVAMTFYHAGLTTREKFILEEVIGRAFTVLFALEIMVRIYGYYHWRQFWKKARNRVDLLIVIATIIDEIPVIHKSKYHMYFLVFSVVRSYRISYLFPGVLQLLSDVIGDGQGIMNLTFFTFLTLFLLSPISVQLFGNDFGFVDEDEPSMRFDNSYQAFLALFQIMTGENWTDILYDAMHSQEHASVAYAAIFMIFLYFAVHYMVLNLFIAVIMENFDLDEEEIKQIQIKKYIREHRWKPEYYKMDNISRILLPLFMLQDEKRIKVKNIPQDLVANVTSSKFKEFLVEDDTYHWHEHYDTHSLISHAPASRTPSRRNSSVHSFRKGHRRSASNVSQMSNSSIVLEDTPLPYALAENGREQVVKYGDEYELNVARENKAVIAENLSAFRSVIFLATDNAVRKFCVRVAKMKNYNWFIISMICLNTAMALWADEHNREAHPFIAYTVLEPIHNMLLLVYWIDIFIHIVADGLIMLPKSYLRNTWNALDMILLIMQSFITVLSVTKGEETDIGFITYAGYLRIFRTMRSLRIVYYIQGMRVIFLDLIYGLPKMIDAVTLNILVFVPFAIYGCFLFSGRFKSCNDGAAESMLGCFGEFVSTDDDNGSILVPRVWQNPYDYSFDSFGKSLLHLFENASGEGWILSLFSAMSIPSNNRTDQARFSWSSASIFHSVYYVVFMFVASLCSIQLFIGVFLEIFKQRNGISSMTNTQRQFQDLQRQLALVKPSLKSERPRDTFRAIFYDLVIDKRGKFAQFMATVLTANIVVFATEHLHQPLWLTYLQTTLNGIFLSLYVFEMGAKIAGLGFSKWASARWNIYDMVLVGLTIISSIPKLFIELPYWLDVARRLFLVGIAFRLAQRNESLDTLFRSVKRALPSIFYVSTVFAIVIICFGAIFQEYFSSTRYGPYGNDHANFRSFRNTVLTLFRITTGENWDFLMHDFTVLPPNCVKKDDCGSRGYAIVIFVIFYIVCTFIFVNLFTVIVIDNFSFTFDKRNQFTLITRTDLRHFKTAWSVVDPGATGFIAVEDVPKFLRHLTGVLAVHVYDDEYNIQTMLDASNVIAADPSHVISAPLSERQLSTEYGGTNMLSERPFNFYELNRCLSTIDPRSIRERKREYTLVYQEIINAATYRGVSFHCMLEILALRLVDIAKSLTFDELVNRARIQDKVATDLATERATSLAHMVVLRRKYLKIRQRARNDQLMKSKSNSIANWLPSTSRNSSPIRERGNPFVQLGSLLKKSSGTSDRSTPKAKVDRGAHNFGVPTIVVDRPQSFDNAMMLVPETIAELKHHTLRLPDRFSTFNTTSSSGILSKRKSTIIKPVTIGTPQRRMSSRPSTASGTSSSHISGTGLSQPKSQIKRASALSIRRMSIAAITPHSGNGVHNEEYETMTPEGISNDVFTQYYAIDSAMDDMTNGDAETIVNKFNNTTWSSLLDNSDTISDDDEEENDTSL